LGSPPKKTIHCSPPNGQPCNLFPTGSIRLRNPGPGRQGFRTGLHLDHLLHQLRPGRHHQQAGPPGRALFSLVCIRSRRGAAEVGCGPRQNLAHSGRTSDPHADLGKPDLLGLLGTSVPENAKPSGGKGVPRCHLSDHPGPGRHHLFRHDPTRDLSSASYVPRTGLQIFAPDGNSRDLPSTRP
jgi:hypothetical protein